MTGRQRILFLYSEISTYFIACVKALAQSDIEVHLVKWPINKEAPFSFEEDAAVTIYERDALDVQSLIELIDHLSPAAIVCSGWIDKGYLKAIRQRKDKTCPIVLCLDNPWHGSIKQLIASWASPFFIKKIFSHCWVPGERQIQYAKRLGFTKNSILTGLYCADTFHFEKVFNDTFSEKRKAFPRKFLYFGRYVKQKGIEDLWEAFTQAKKENKNDWELICAGTGELFDQKVEHPEIKHLGFVQSSSIENLIKETGVFVLPSYFEPWAVAVHEFSLAGYPLLCSNEVGANEAFLHRDNGLSFSAGNRQELKESFITIMNKSDKALIQMGEKSHQYGKKMQVSDWVKTIKSIL